jgi:hypothetical protein
MTRLSARAYAKRIGVSGSDVSRLVRDGKLPVDAQGMIDPEDADRFLEARREPARTANRQLPSDIAHEPRSTDLSTLLLKARTKTEVEKGRLLELKAKVEASNLSSVARRQTTPKSRYRRRPKRSPAG